MEMRMRMMIGFLECVNEKSGFEASTKQDSEMAGEGGLE
jgi:hypothetical protein